MSPPPKRPQAEVRSRRQRLGAASRHCHRKQEKAESCRIAPTYGGRSAGQVTRQAAQARSFVTAFASYDARNCEPFVVWVKLTASGAILPGFTHLAHPIALTSAPGAANGGFHPHFTHPTLMRSSKTASLPKCAEGGRRSVRQRRSNPGGDKRERSSASSRRHVGAAIFSSNAHIDLRVSIPTCRQQQDSQVYGQDRRFTLTRRTSEGARRRWPEIAWSRKNTALACASDWYEFRERPVWLSAVLHLIPPQESEPTIKAPEPASARAPRG